MQPVHANHRYRKYALKWPRLCGELWRASRVYRQSVRDKVDAIPLEYLIEWLTCVFASRSDVGGVHDLHRGGTRRRLYRPHIRYPATLRPRISAQIQLPRTENVQVTTSTVSRTQN